MIIKDRRPDVYYYDCIWSGWIEPVRVARVVDLRPDRGRGRACLRICLWHSDRRRFTCMRRKRDAMGAFAVLNTGYQEGIPHQHKLENRLPNEDLIR